MKQSDDNHVDTTSWLHGHCLDRLPLHPIFTLSGHIKFLYENKQKHTQKIKYNVKKKHEEIIFAILEMLLPPESPGQKYKANFWSSNTSETFHTQITVILSPDS